MQAIETSSADRRDLLKRTLKHTSRTEWSQRLNPHLDREYIVPVLLNAIAILQLLREHENGLKLSQIQELTGIPKTTAYRILRTYVATGHVRSVDTGHYTIAVH